MHISVTAPYEPFELANETVVNATGDIVLAFTWPTMPANFHLYAFNIIANVVIIIVTLIIGKRCLNLQLKQTSGHAFYCTLGMVLCISQSIAWGHQTLHVAFGLVGIVIGFMGVSTEILYIRHKKRKHCRTKHSILGLIACILLLITFFTGMYLIFHRMYLELQHYVLLLHRLCGLLSFVLLMTSLIFSCNSGFMRRNWNLRFITCLKCWILVAIFMTAFTQLKRIINTVIYTFPGAFKNIDL